MSLDQEGLESKIKAQVYKQEVSEDHELIRLGNEINFEELFIIVADDLKKTAKGLWWLGRSLRVRIHLGVYLLQVRYKETDRGIEGRIKDTPVLQAFAGQGMCKKWKCPDHTKIEEFRNRLKPETHREIANYMAQLGCKLGYGDASWMDVDSTVQEANMAYPSDSQLMRKLVLKGKKIAEGLKGKMSKESKRFLERTGAIMKKAQEYYFLSKNTGKEKKRKVFKGLHTLVKKEMGPLLDFLDKLPKKDYNGLKYNIRKRVDQLREVGRKYLKDVSHFIRTHTIKPGKRLCFHLKAVACIRKGKVGKDNEFGRVYQLGRIGGNFLIVGQSDTVRMEDKPSLIPMMKEHEKLFGRGVLKSLATDKGYYTKKNVGFVNKKIGESAGIQRPRTVKDQVPRNKGKPLRNRRAGIEPMISHAKDFGLRRSKMKTDETTLSSGYRSILGLNLHQLSRHLEGEFKPKRAKQASFA